MNGVIIKTKGIALTIRPWSRTSHIVTWITPDHGIVTTVVKGAVRPKSACLGQYDLFYTCDLLYYARASNDLHALREVVPTTLREPLRGRWREIILAGYAADLVRELTPAGDEAAVWYTFLEDFLDRLAEPASAQEISEPLSLPARLVELEVSILRLAGLAPDLSELDPHVPWTLFSVDRGRCGTGARTVRLAASTASVLSGRRGTAAAVADAVRFLGVFLAFHLDRPPDIRRTVLALLGT